MVKKDEYKFTPPPLTPEQKQKRIKEILGETTKEASDPSERDTSRITLTMRVPKFYIEDLDRIAKLTGQTKNAIYIDILGKAIKAKLKEMLEK